MTTMTCTQTPARKVRDTTTGRTGQTRSTRVGRGTTGLGPDHGPATSDGTGRANGPQRVMVTWDDGTPDDVPADSLDNR